MLIYFFEIPEHSIRQGETRQVRPYQREAIQALDHAIELGTHHFLIELPAGTGKMYLNYAREHWTHRLLEEHKER